MANATLGAVLQHLHAVADASTGAEATDGQLLGRFLIDREESAFAALVRRHGPMVLSVCRRVLHNAHDAEDVFQAAFLLLARKAATTRKPESVASWLHGVAYNLALKARTQKARRQAHERRAGTMRKTEPTLKAAWHELQALVDEALLELPAKYRTALVLCYLEGKTHEEIARPLGSPLGTVRAWMARGRKLLQARLARRGVVASAATLAAVVATSSARAALPRSLMAPTVTAALQYAAGRPAAAVVTGPVAALVNGWTKTVLATRFKLATVLLALSAALVSGGGGTYQLVAAPDPETTPGRSVQTVSDDPASPRPTPDADRGRSDTALAIRGRVVDPDGKALAGAKLSVYGMGRLKTDSRPTPRATSGAEGCFHFAVECAELVNPDAVSPWASVVLVATAPGYGPKWVPIDPAARGADTTIRVVRDDVPIRGRILDLQGRPSRSRSGNRARSRAAWWTSPASRWAGSAPASSPWSGGTRRRTGVACWRGVCRTRSALIVPAGSVWRGWCRA
jgi:RNA polymerase sigma factor (sigma-70 family)